MKKQMIFLALTALLVILLSSTVSAAPTYNNSTNNRTNFTYRDIQPVINHIGTTDNNTVVIKQGNYSAVNLTKRLTLKWDGNGTRPVIPSIYIGSAGSGSRLIGLHIKNILNSNGTGITLVNASNVVIEDCIIEGFADNTGIFLLNASDNTINRSSIINNSNGILLTESLGNVLSGNSITNSTNNGIVLDSSLNNTLTGNTITDSWHGIRLDNSLNSIISGNSIIYVRPCDWWWEAIANATDDSDGIVLHNSLNNTLTGNSITGSWHGIRLNNSLNSIISENNIVDTFDNGIVLINSSNNTISGNSISGNRDDGIVFYGPSNNNTITDNTITDNIENGIVVGESLNNTISGNTITDNTLGGIILSDSQNNDLTNNTVLNNLEGIILENAPSNTLRNNIINNNTQNFGVHGWGDLINYRQDIDTSNTINGNPIFYLMDQIGDAFDGIAMGFLGVVNSTNLTFSNMNITNNIQGVLLAGSNNITIRDSSFSYNLDGIYLIESNGINIHGNAISDNNNHGIGLLWDSSNNTISGNTIDNNNHGIGLLWDSSNNTISGNTIDNNNWNGIWLTDSSNNTISGNTIDNNNWNGIWLTDSSNNTISGNTIDNNNWNGIWLTDSSNNNTISGNSITGNVDAILLWDSSNNTISKNSITGNWRGIFLRGTHTGNSIHFNRIIPIASTFAIKNDGPNSVNASYNWYGRNENVTALISGNVTYAPWLVLSINATPGKIYTGDTSTVTADLRHDSNGTLHNETFLMDGIPVTFSGTPGTVDPVSGSTTDSRMVTTFTAPNTAGFANVTAAVDTQTVFTPINIAALPTATVSPREGNFYNNVTVNLTSTGGFDPVSIFFTTNGTTPTNASTLYTTTPLTFNTTTTLRFKAQDGLGTNSSVITETYKIYRQVAYTYHVRVPAMRWVRRWIRGRHRWVRVRATIKVRRWIRGRRRGVRVHRYTTVHRTGHRWELT